MGGGLQAAVIVIVHHGVLQDFLDAVDAAALAARAQGRAGDRVVAAHAVHLTAGLLAVLLDTHTHTPRVNTHTPGSALAKGHTHTWRFRMAS